MSASSVAASPSKVSELADVFTALKTQGRAALAPFVTAGDPDMETTLAVLESLDRAGASLCELGVPYSDPIADGPVIQSSYTRALAAGFTLERLFELSRQATQRVKMPILAMASYSLIYRRGIDRFVADAKAAGLTGFVVPDLPIEESDQLDAACRQAGWKGPLNRCSVFGDKTVGKRFAKMLEMGQSRPWPEALEAFTGEKTIDASAMAEYFAPLNTWLTAQNKGQTCGWKD